MRRTKPLNVRKGTQGFIETIKDKPLSTSLGKAQTLDDIPEIVKAFYDLPVSVLPKNPRLRDDDSEINSYSRPSRSPLAYSVRKGRPPKSFSELEDLAFDEVNSPASYLTRWSLRNQHGGDRESRATYLSVSTMRDEETGVFTNTLSAYVHDGTVKDGASRVTIYGDPGEDCLDLGSVPMDGHTEASAHVAALNHLKKNFSNPQVKYVVAQAYDYAVFQTQ